MSAKPQLVQTSGSPSALVRYITSSRVAPLGKPAVLVLGPKVMLVLRAVRLSVLEKPVSSKVCTRGVNELLGVAVATLSITRARDRLRPLLTLPARSMKNAVGAVVELYVPLASVDRVMSTKPALMCAALSVVKPTWVPLALVEVLMRT